MCIHCDEYSRENKYCDECLDIRLTEILREQEPNISMFMIELFIQLLKMNYWALKNFLDKYDIDKIEE